ncbi:MAG: 50S ribosomal protein L6 [Candidatus Fluviicola riflensis]|nr:MAG: 50S ribosomal protein L6 [Candidatus Fluviicola riflensis]OGS77287.1 MAG: 50S ribosomal protein L6 [Candidatus Fluviicola riflensis]OGS82222.1 MAG: 50S ribosomal protein L6 [Fluviicola sp. RIFCSPHIGHO2_01_FULL_43_53]OGS87915.1 MAG: 50S ribosomal protein L6 [Fluviicola sp. RIFCSPHIGHO2_12_FULL_43_24]
MSRIGKSPVTIPSGVEVKVEGSTVSVKGPKGQLQQELDSCVTINIEGSEITFTRASDAPDHRAKHGLYRSLVHNMIVGVSEGYKKEMEVIGVGYRATATGQLLELSLGYSHPIAIELPKEIKVSADTQKGKAPVVTLESYDKQLLGQVAAKIRSLRKPEPYKGKGIRFMGEEIRRKAGKSAGKK